MKMIERFLQTFFAAPPPAASNAPMTSQTHSHVIAQVTACSKVRR